jgi:signal transduction histidine kinase
VAGISGIRRETADAHSDLRIEHHISVEESQISEDRKIVVFRTIEEVLKNFSSHVNAGMVKILLQGIMEHLVLTIKTQSAPELLTLPVIHIEPFELLDIPKLKRRIESCGGDFGLELHPDHTTIMKASWPFP